MVAGSPISSWRRARVSATRAVSSAVRSGAAKSVASSTPWTNVPMSTPAGISASRDGTSSSAGSPPGTAGGGVAGSGSSSVTPSSGSLATRASCAAAVMSL